jgi:hypothetical protein
MAKVSVKGTFHKQVEVTLPESELVDHVKAIVRRHHNIREGDFLRGNTVVYDDPDHRHGSIRELERGPASELQLLGFQILDYLGKLNLVLTSEENRSIMDYVPGLRRPQSPI